jgi:hypothetical protein
MATSRRRQVRLSLLALLVSYLRDGTTDTSGFAAYPSEQDIYSFSIGDELYQVTVAEAGQPPLPVGVTILFAGDRAVKTERVRAQPWETQIRIEVALPRNWTGDSLVQEVAQKIDEALWGSRGHVAITDWLAAVPAGDGTFLEWETEPRGDWTFENAENGFDRMALEFTAAYP